jgi:hypothetical protein
MSVVSAAQKVNLVKGGGYSAPHHQRLISHDKLQITTLASNPAPASTGFANGSVHLFKVDFRKVGKIHNMKLRFDITETGGAAAMFLAPVPYFVSKIEWLSNSGSGPVFFTQYPDSTYWESLVLPDAKKLTRSYLKELNIKEDYYGTFAHPLSKQRSYRLPLITHPFDINEMYCGEMKEVECRLTLRSGITASGSGVVGLTQVSLEVEHSVVPDEHKGELLKHMYSPPLRHVFLEATPLQKTSQTFTASTQKDISLDVFTGKAAGLIFAIRDDAFAVSGSTILKTYDLGDSASIDIVSSTGKSMLGDGTAIRCDYLVNQLYAHHFDNSEFIRKRKWYVIPFCNSLKSAFHGNMSGGFLEFPAGHQYSLRITPSAAGVAGVHTLTCTNPANDGGSYRLMFRGAQTDSLAYNANAAAMKAAFEALPTALAADGVPLTVTASGALTTTATLTFSANAEPLNELDDLVRVNAQGLKDDTATENIDESITTYGTKGWTTGSTYTIDIYMLKFMQLWSNGFDVKSDSA